MTYLEIDPARAKRVSDKKLADIWDSGEWIAEEKLDGWRYLLHFGRGMPRTYLTGRRISKETGFLSEKGEQVPQLWPSSKVQSDFLYTVLDGEIYPPEGASFRDIASIMNSDLDTAQATIKRIGPPTFRAFDILYVNDIDVRGQMFLQRRKGLEAMVSAMNHPLISVVPQMAPIRSYYDKIVARGGEGLILKDLGAPYGEGWVKVKREHTLDVVVTGFTDARFGRTGKFYGQIGAACVSVYTTGGGLVEVGQVSGMDDETRRHMTDNKGEWLGSVIEITAQEWAKDRLRHPRYSRRREDVDARSCTFKKMMRDLGREEEDKCEDEKQLQLF